MPFIILLLILMHSFYAHSNSASRPSFCDDPARLLEPWEVTECPQEDRMDAKPDQAARTGGCEFSVYIKYENGNSHGLAGPLSDNALDSKCKSLGQAKYKEQVDECNRTSEKHTRHFEVRNNLKVLFSKDLNCSGLRDAGVKHLPSQNRPYRQLPDDELRRRNRGSLGAP